MLENSKKTVIISEFIYQSELFMNSGGLLMSYINDLDVMSDKDVLKYALINDVVAPTTIKILLQSSNEYRENIKLIYNDLEYYFKSFNIVI